MLRLQTLKLSCWNPDATLTLGASLGSLTTLRSLNIDAEEWQLGSNAALPPSLTRLKLCEHADDELPAGVTTLTRLRRLELFGVRYTAAGMAGLARLSGTLRIASFDGCKLPGCLGQLTGLEALQVNWLDAGDRSEAALQGGALRSLTRLTGLWFSAQLAAAIVLPCLAGLTRLQWLYFWPLRGAEDSAALPVGPWQRSLQCLAVQPWLLLRSQSFLSGAERLQHDFPLGWPGEQGGSDEQWRAFWAWAERHPPLELLCLTKNRDLLADPPCPEAVLGLKARRPGLDYASPPASEIDHKAWHLGPLHAPRYPS